MATLKAYRTPLRRSAMDEEDRLRQIVPAGTAYNPPSAAGGMFGNRPSGAVFEYTRPAAQMGDRTLSSRAESLMGTARSYAPPASTGGGAIVGTSGAIGSGGSMVNPTGANGMGSTGGGALGTVTDAQTSATTATGLPNNSYQYADMYGDANTLLAYKALPEYLSAQGLRNQGMSETAWLAIRNGYQPPQAASGGAGGAGGAGGGGKPLSAMGAIRRGSGKDRSWLQQYSDIDYDYSAPVAAPSGGGTPTPTPTLSYEGLTQEQLDQMYKMNAYGPHSPDVVFRNGEEYYRDAPTRAYPGAQGGTYSDAMAPLKRAQTYAGILEEDYLRAFDNAYRVGDSKATPQERINANLYRMGYYIDSAGKWHKDEKKE